MPQFGNRFPPIFMCEVDIPSNISVYLLPAECTHHSFLGNFNVIDNTCNVVEPLLL